MSFQVLTPNARFEDAGAKITLRPGQRLAHYQAWPTEEGYGFNSRCFHYDGEHVHLHLTTGGRDCDGGHSVSRHLVLNDDGLTWADVEPGRQWDQFAQAAGY